MTGDGREPDDAAEKSKALGPRWTYKRIAMYAVPAAALLALVVTLPVCLSAPRCGATSSSDSSDDGASSTTSGSATSSTASTSAASPSTISGGGGATTSVGLGSTFIYELDNTPVAAPDIVSTAGVSVDGSVYIVDMEHSTKEQIDAYKAAGKTVVCYFSAGTWEPKRGDALAFDGSCVCSGGQLQEDSCSSSDNKMSDWNEWWLDIHSDSCKANVQNVMEGRIKAAKSKGCDGVDPDNVDSYTNTDEQKHGNTEQDQLDYLLWLSATARDNQLLIDLKNSGAMLQGDHKDKILEAFDFAVIEQCHLYDECAMYEPFINANKPNFQIEYGTNIKSCPTLKSGQHLLVYSEDTLDTGKITQVCN